MTRPQMPSHGRTHSNPLWRYCLTGLILSCLISCVHAQDEAPIQNPIYDRFDQIDAELDYLKNDSHVTQREMVLLRMELTEETTSQIHAEFTRIVVLSILAVFFVASTGAISSVFFAWLSRRKRKKQQDKYKELLEMDKAERKEALASMDELLTGAEAMINTLKMATVRLGSYEKKVRDFEERVGKIAQATESKKPKSWWRWWK